MSITDYINTREKGVQLNDTLIHLVTEAYVVGARALYNEEGLIDRKKAKEKDVQESAGKSLYEILKTFAVEHFGATTTDDTRIRNLVYGTFGVRSEHLVSYFRETEEQVSFPDLLNKMQRNQVGILGYLLSQNIIEAPKSTLSVEDATEVVEHTQTNGHVDPHKLTIDHMSELLNEFLEKGEIAKAFLKGKDYGLDLQFTNYR